MTEYRFEGFNLARDIVHQTAVEKGWWELQLMEARDQDGLLRTVFIPRSTGDLIALVHSEASEALEEVRAGRGPTDVHYSYRSLPNTPVRPVSTYENQVYVWDDSEAGIPEYEAPGPGWKELTPETAAMYGYDVKPEGVPIELADVIIRVLDMCGHYGIDIEAAMLQKAKYNETRTHRHGGKTL